MVPSQLVPSENELSKTYGISRMTARSVLMTLVKEGLIYRVQGKGTYVSQPKISTTSPAYVGIREQLEKQGYSITTQVINYEIIEAPKRVAEALNLSPKAQIIHIKRVRYANEEPVSIHESYLPYALCHDFDKSQIVTTQLCNILENNYGLISTRVHETLESVIAIRDESELLRIDKGYPLLLLNDINYNSAGVPFEFSKIVFRGDKIKLEFDY